MLHTKFQDVHRTSDYGDKDFKGSYNIYWHTLKDFKNAKK